MSPKNKGEASKNRKEQAKTRPRISSGTDSGLPPGMSSGTNSGGKVAYSSGRNSGQSPGQISGQNSGENTASRRCLTVSTGVQGSGQSRSRGSDSNEGSNEAEPGALALIPFCNSTDQEPQMVQTQPNLSTEMVIKNFNLSMAPNLQPNANLPNMVFSAGRGKAARRGGLGRGGRGSSGKAEAGGNKERSVGLPRPKRNTKTVPTDMEMEQQGSVKRKREILQNTLTAGYVGESEMNKLIDETGPSRKKRRDVDLAVLGMEITEASAPAAVEQPRRAQ